MVMSNNFAKIEDFLLKCPRSICSLLSFWKLEISYLWHQIIFSIICIWNILFQNEALGSINRPLCKLWKSWEIFNTHSSFTLYCKKTLNEIILNWHIMRSYFIFRLGTLILNDIWSKYILICKSDFTIDDLPTRL